MYVCQLVFWIQNREREDKWNSIRRIWQTEYWTRDKTGKKNKKLIGDWKFHGVIKVLKWDLEQCCLCVCVCVCVCVCMGFLGSSVIKSPLANTGATGDRGSIFGLGRSSGGGNGNPLQDPCLDNPMDRGALWVTVRGITKNRTQLSEHTHSKMKYNKIINEWEIHTNSYNLQVREWPDYLCEAT